MCVGGCIGEGGPSRPSPARPAGASAQRRGRARPRDTGHVARGGAVPPELPGPRGGMLPPTPTATATYPMSCRRQARVSCRQRRAALMAAVAGLSPTRAGRRRRRSWAGPVRGAGRAGPGRASAGLGGRGRPFRARAHLASPPHLFLPHTHTPPSPTRTPPPHRTATHAPFPPPMYTCTPTHPPTPFSPYTHLHTTTHTFPPIHHYTYTHHHPPAPRHTHIYTPAYIPLFPTYKPPPPRPLHTHFSGHRSSSPSPETPSIHVCEDFCAQVGGCRLARCQDRAAWWWAQVTHVSPLNRGSPPLRAACPRPAPRQDRRP